MLKEAIFHKIESDYAYAIAPNKVLLKIRVK
ncbi:MAG: alpha amylase N-terminal ig-like domain-containing protein, partial [Promethearchaeota archaeon]